mgnify:CR=1 FL=1
MSGVSSVVLCRQNRVRADSRKPAVKSQSEQSEACRGEESERYSREPSVELTGTVVTEEVDGKGAFRASEVHRW